jgi:hypothetical protein
MSEQSSNPPTPRRRPRRPGLLGLAATPELVGLIKSSPENLSLFKDLSMRIARDPHYLAYLEKNFKGPISPALEELLKETPVASELESHNWGEDEELPSPKKAAAALLPAAAAISDIRLKEAITLLRHLPSGIGLYRYRYKSGSQAYVGVMAQEVAGFVPAAVVRGEDGFLRVNYDKLGLRLTTWDEWKASRIRRGSESADFG